MSFEDERPWRGEQGRSVAMARRSAPLGGQLPSISWSSGHDPSSAFDRADSELREAREIGRCGKEAEIGVDP